MTDAWNETFAERLDDDYAAAAQPAREQLLADRAEKRAARQARVIPAEAARNLFAQFKRNMATLAELEEWDHHYDLLHDLLDWGHKTARHLGDRHGGYLVVLDRGLRDEDTILIMRFLLNIAGVIAVDPIPENAGMHIAERRALYRMKTAIEEAIHDG